MAQKVPHPTVGRNWGPASHDYNGGMFTAPIRIFLSSFLVLFLEVALIRWLPSQIRLLSYFSNFILLAAFLGIGIGALLGRLRRSLFAWYPCCCWPSSWRSTSSGSRSASAPGQHLLHERHERPGDGGGDDAAAPGPVRRRRRALHRLAQRMAEEMTALRPLRAYTINLIRQPHRRRGLRAGLWLEAPPSSWFIIALAAALPLLRRRRWTTGTLAASCASWSRRPALPTWSAARSGPRTTRSRSRRRAPRRWWRSTTSGTVDGAGRHQGVLLPVAVQGVRRLVQGRSDPRRGHRHRCRRGAQAQRRQRRRGGD